MRFNYQPEIYSDGGKSEHWFSGIYKITKYEEDLDNKSRPAYRPYFKPHGWKNWGNSVNNTQQDSIAEGRD